MIFKSSLKLKHSLVDNNLILYQKVKLGVTGYVCGQILKDSFETYKTFPRCILYNYWVRVHCRRSKSWIWVGSFSEKRVLLGIGLTVPLSNYYVEICYQLNPFFTSFDQHCHRFLQQRDVLLLKIIPWAN